METVVRALLPAVITIALLLSILAVMYAISWTIEFHL